MPRVHVSKLTTGLLPVKPNFDPIRPEIQPKKNVARLFLAYVNIIIKSLRATYEANGEGGTVKYDQVRYLANNIVTSCSDQHYDVDKPPGGASLTALILGICAYFEDNKKIPTEDRALAAHVAVDLWTGELGKFYVHLCACMAKDPGDSDAGYVTALMKEGAANCDFRDGSAMLGHGGSCQAGKVKHLYSGRERVTEATKAVLDRARDNGGVIKIVGVMATTTDRGKMKPSPCCVRIDIREGCWDSETGEPLGQIICRDVHYDRYEGEVIVFPGSKFHVKDRLMEDRGVTYVLEPVSAGIGVDGFPVHMGGGVLSQPYAMNSMQNTKTATMLEQQVKKMPPHTCGVYGIEALRVFENSPAPELDEVVSAAASLPLGSPERTIAKKSTDTRRCLEDIFYTITALQTPYTVTRQGGAARTPSTRIHPDVLKGVVDVFKAGQPLVRQFSASMVRLPEMMVRPDTTPEHIAQYINQHGFEGITRACTKPCPPAAWWNLYHGKDTRGVAEQSPDEIVREVYRVLNNVQSHRSVVAELEFWPVRLHGSDNPPKDWFCIDTLFSSRPCMQTCYPPEAKTMQGATLEFVQGKRGCLNPLSGSGGSMGAANTCRKILVFRQDYKATITALCIDVQRLAHQSASGEAASVCVLHRVDVCTPGGGAEESLASQVRMCAVNQKDATLKNLWYSASLAHMAASPQGTNPKSVNVEYALELGEQKEMDVYSIKTNVDLQTDVHITMAVVRGGGEASAISTQPLAQPTVHYFRVTEKKPRASKPKRPKVAAAGVPRGMDNRWNVYYQSVDALEYLAASSVPLNKYISKGGILTPPAMKSTDPWGKAVVCLMQGDREGSMRHMEDICGKISHAKDVLDSLRGCGPGRDQLMERYAAAVEKLDAAVSDKTQSASVIRAISSRYMQG